MDPVILKGQTAGAERRDKAMQERGFNGGFEGAVFRNDLIRSYFKNILK